MDNQIRKLAERAGYISGEPTAEAFNEFNINKFANSILDQVLLICDEVATPFPDDDTMVPGAQVCAEMIRENFGIKK